MSLASYFALLLLGALLGAVAHALVISKPVASSNTGSSPIPTNIFSPRIPTIMTPDDQYVGWSDAVNENWFAIISGEPSPSLDGILRQPLTANTSGSGEGVWIPDAEKYGLGEGFPAPSHSKRDGNTENKFYHISNQHQLHCLVSGLEPPLEHGPWLTLLKLSEYHPHVSLPQNRGFELAI